MVLFLIIFLLLISFRFMNWYCLNFMHFVFFLFYSVNGGWGIFTDKNNEALYLYIIFHFSSLTIIIKYVSSKVTKAKGPQAHELAFVGEQVFTFHSFFQKCTQSLTALTVNNLFSFSAQNYSGQMIVTFYCISFIISLMSSSPS